MNAARTIFSILAAVLLWQIPLCGRAQIDPPADLGYPPPPGWEYVMNLDSANFLLYAHNDSLVTYIYKSGSFSSPDLWKHSTDGGKTWNPSSMPKGFRGNIEGTTILWNYQVDKDSINTLFISTDLGQTWQERAIMNDFVPNVKICTPERWGINESEKEDVISDLHNPYGTWFIKYKINQTAYTFVYYSTDAGFTWKLLEIPPPSNYQIANRVIFDIKFDYREPDAWYFMSRGIYYPHFGDNDTATEYYVSRDQGKTYKQIPVFGDFIGVTKPAEHFFWTKSDEACFYPNINGFQILDSLGNNKEYIRFTETLFPYRYPLDTSKCDGPTIDLRTTLIFSSDPTQSIFCVNQVSQDKDKDTVYSDTSWLFSTKNVHKTDELIFQRGTRGLILNSWQDSKTGNVWIETTDTPIVRVYNNGYLFRKSLWKRKVFTLKSTVVGNGATENVTLETAIMYRQAGPPDLIVRQPRAKQTRIALYDILGNELALIFDGALAAGEYRFRLWEATGRSTQSLFVRIGQADWSKTEKIIIQH